MENSTTISSSPSTTNQPSYPSWATSRSLLHGESLKRDFESSNDFSKKIPRLDSSIVNNNNRLPGLTTLTKGLNRISSAPVSQLLTSDSDATMNANNQIATPQSTVLNNNSFQSINQNLSSPQPTISNTRGEVPKSPSQSASLHPSETSSLSSPSPTSPGSEDVDASGRSRPNRLLSQSKRAVQNRTAQRAFRQRKELYIRDLESKVDELREAHKAIADLRQENTELRDYILALQSRYINEPGLPTPPAVYKLYRRGIINYGNNNGNGNGNGNNNNNNNNYSHHSEARKNSNVSSDGKNMSD